MSALPDDLRGGAVAIGNFDGVHRGHARLVQRLRETARRLEGPAVVLTFDPSPTTILHAEASPAQLSWLQRKADLLGSLGVDAVIAYPTDRDLLELSPESFFQRIVVDWLAARAMTEGTNFRFGRRRSGDVERLGRLCRAAGVALEVVEPIQLAGETVSSSRIRRLIAAGQVETAARLLIEPYRIRGAVAGGSRRGESLGYPTANLQGVDTLLPGEGIYAGHAYLDGHAEPAAISVGPNPTFDEDVRKVEAYLLDFQGDLYGRTVELDFVARMRDIIQFGSADELVGQLDRDVRQTREILGQSVTAGSRRPAHRETP
ncbi:MAG: bifunctional riboflavin kinase/FAD synthetase [Pirellulales bacterium]